MLNKKYILLSFILLSFCIGADSSNPISCIQQKMGCMGAPDQWEEIGKNSATGGGISNNWSLSRFPSLAIDASNNPIVAWVDDFSSEAYNVYLKQWNGTKWEELGGSATGSGISNNSDNLSNPSLAVNNSGNPVVAWQDYSTGNYGIYLKQWNGTSWEELGGSASNNGISAGGSPSLVMNNSGNPIVAWHDGTYPDYDIYLKQWNGTSWEEIGGSASGGGISDDSGLSRSPSLAIDNSGNPVVAWVNDDLGHLDIYIKQWNGSNWVEISTGSASGTGISESSSYSLYPSLAINNNGNPVVVWIENVNNGQKPYLKQWNGSEWEELAGSATDAGIGGYKSASSPSIGINDDGYLIVAWSEDFSDGSAIYVKQWNGTSWGAMGEGSCPDEENTFGISASIFQSDNPSLAIDNSGNPVVAWEETPVTDNHEIYIRRYVPTE